MHQLESEPSKKIINKNSGAAGEAFSLKTSSRGTYVKLRELVLQISTPTQSFHCVIFLSGIF